MSDIILTNTPADVIVTETPATPVVLHSSVEPDVVVIETPGASTTVTTTEAGGIIIQTVTGEASVIETTSTGPQGPPGISGNTVSLVAGAVLGGHRAIVIDSGLAVYADNANPDHGQAVAGITINAAEEGAAVSVCMAGPLTEPSWNWTPKLPIWLGSNGMLTQTRPGTGFVLKLGFAETPTTMCVRIGRPITLAN